MLKPEQLKEDLKAAYIEARNSEAGEDKALDVFTGKLAEIIVKHIKTLEVVYTNGLAAGANPVVGTFNHTIK